MTNILMLTLVYGPDTVSTANMMTDIAHGLSDNGHNVTVLTSVPHYNPPKEVLDNPSMRSSWRKPFTESIEHGVRVLRVFMPPKRHKIWARAFDYIIFQVLTTILALFRVSRPDVVFVTSPPITLGVSGILIAWMKGGRFVYDVRELWPDVPVRMGLFRNPLLIKFVYWLEDFVYKKSVAISTIARSFQNTLVDRGVPRKKLYFTPNFVDIGFIMPSDSKNEFSSANGLDDMFVVLYAGNVGLTQGLEILLEVASEFTINKTVQFVVVGDGAARSGLETALTQSNLTNIRMLPFQPIRLVNSMYATADVCIVPLLRGFSYDTVPSKIYTAMAAGRPVLASAEIDSETALLLNESSAGVCVEPESPEALIEAITSLYKNPNHVSDMGNNGRKWIVNYYARSVVIDAYDNMVREVSG
jgi:colanic acid biosynthesis glycosyl transferase WcaI